VHDTHAVSDSDAAYFGLRPLEGTNVCHRFRIRTAGLPQGEPYTADPEPDDHAEGFDAAQVIVDETFRMPAVQHVAMEPHACIAGWRDGRLEVTTGTQTPFNMRQDLAGLFGLPDTDVRIVCPPMGGSFGAKTFVRTEAIAAAVARRLDRPVRLALDRDEEFVTLTRHAATVRVRLGATRDGRFVAKRVWCWVNTGAYADCGPGVAMKMGYAGVGPYRFDHVAVDSFCVYTNLRRRALPRLRRRPVGVGLRARHRPDGRRARRRPGRAAPPEPARRRRRLLHGRDHARRPFRGAPRRRRPGRRLAARRRQPRQGRRRDAQGDADAQQGRGRPPPRRRRPLRGAQRHHRDGTGLGQGDRALAADLLGVEPDQVEVPPPDTDRVPYDTRTTSSRSTHMMGRALEAAVEDLKNSGGDYGHGRIANEGGLDVDTGQGIAVLPLAPGRRGGRGRGRRRDRAPDAALGARLLLRRPGRQPGRGRAAAGGLDDHGIGTTLFEELTFDQGHVVGPNLSDYNIPSALDCAAVTQTLLEVEGAEVHGLGETALPPVPPAIGNALATLGYRPTELPLTPERVLDCAEDAS
jgi:CO/xanthine dehydrogenase Mo-binding subunit